MSNPPIPGPFASAPKDTPPEKAATVFLPPAEVLRRLAPAPPPPAPAVRPAPDPDSPKLKDRISIGPPVDARQKGPLILRREDDLTQVPKGLPDGAPTPAPAPAAPPQRAEGGSPQIPGREGLRLPPGLGRDPSRGEEGSPGRPGQDGPSIASSLRNLDERLQRDARLGLPSGTGQQLFGLFFDPQGADFTSWINHFKNEVYRNWIVPTPALMGFKGHVDFEFTVERDGSVSSLRLLKSSGTPALDRAAQNALQGGRFQPLPSDFGPPRVTMQVGFYYNESPQGT